MRKQIIVCADGVVWRRERRRSVGILEVIKLFIPLSSKRLQRSRFHLHVRNLHNDENPVVAHSMDSRSLSLVHFSKSITLYSTIGTQLDARLQNRRDHYPSINKACLDECAHTGDTVLIISIFTFLNTCESDHINMSGIRAADDESS